MLKVIKNKWIKFINNLAQANKSNFGEGGINCCELKDANDTNNSKT